MTMTYFELRLKTKIFLEFIFGDVFFIFNFNYSENKKSETPEFNKAFNFLFIINY